MTNRVTISDIAEALKISAISVSRALSGQPGVSEELRNTIIEKANELGYSKAKKTTRYSVLILHQKPYIQDSSNFSSRIHGIERALQKINAEYDMEFVDKDNQDKMHLPFKLTKGSRFDGVIFMGGFNHTYTDFISQRIRNQIFFTGYSPSYDYDSVWFNFNNGGYKQCEYLIKKGHRDIGFLGNSEQFRNKEKLLGITTALEDYGVPVRTELFLDVQDDLNEVVSELINEKRKPTALICQWDLKAIELIKLFYEKGIKVPDDISVMGSGNTEMSSLSIPSLTTLDLHIEYACETAASLLIKRINFPDKPNENIAINSTIIERDSVKSI